PRGPAVGTFEYDLASGKFQTRWDDWTQFQQWLREEEQQNCIELRLVNTYRRPPAYERKLWYICSRHGTGGVKVYTKRHPEWEFKLGLKRTNCACSLIIKQYPGIPTVLGCYSSNHNHPIGNNNLLYTQIPKETKEYIAGLLRLKVAPTHVASPDFTITLSS
ncbi:hypothetical protein DFH08DRAFT_659509, partial [Mycena albidolilacea]